MIKSFNKYLFEMAKVHISASDLVDKLYIILTRIKKLDSKFIFKMSLENESYEYEFETEEDTINYLNETRKPFKVCFYMQKTETTLSRQQYPPFIVNCDFNSFNLDLTNMDLPINDSSIDMIVKEFEKFFDYNVGIDNKIAEIVDTLSKFVRCFDLTYKLDSFSMSNGTVSNNFNMFDDKKITNFIKQDLYYFISEDANCQLDIRFYLTDKVVNGLKLQKPIREKITVFIKKDYFSIEMFTEALENYPLYEINSLDIDESAILKLGKRCFNFIDYIYEDAFYLGSAGFEGYRLSDRLISHVKVHRTQEDNLHSKEYLKNGLYYINLPKVFSDSLFVIENIDSFGNYKKKSCYLDEIF